MGQPSSINLNYQDVLVLIDAQGVVLDASGIEGRCPVAGRTMIAGQVYNAGPNPVVVTVEQGSNDTGGLERYRYPEVFNVPASDVAPLEVPITGKFARITITGDGSTVEAYAFVRGYE